MILIHLSHRAVCDQSCSCAAAWVGCAETQTRHNVLRSEVANSCRQGPRVTSSTAKRGLVKTLGTMIAVAMGLPEATGSELMSPEVAAEYVVRCVLVAAFSAMACA